MNPIKAIILAFIFVAVPTVHAQDAVRTLTPANIPGATGDLRWDVPAGKQTRLTIGDIGNANALRATLLIIKNNKNDKDRLEEPMFTITIRAGREKRVPYATLYLDGNHDDGTYSAAISEYSKFRFVGGNFIKEPIEIGVPLPIAIDWDGQGAVLVKVGNHLPYRMKLNAPVTTVIISSQANKIELSPLLLAHAE